MSQPNKISRRCPLCGKEQAAEFRPFCSARCADIDLGRWLKGSYVVTGGEADEGDSASRPPSRTTDGGIGEREN